MITELASSSCRTKRNGLDLRCALYFSTRSAFSTAIFASSRTLASCSSSSSTLFQLSFPLQNKKKYSLCTLRGTRVSLHIWRKTEIVTSVFARTVFRCFAYYPPPSLPAALSPLSRPFSFFFSSSLPLAFFRISSPSLTCYSCFQICHSHLRSLLIRNSFAHSSQPPSLSSPPSFAWIF